MSIFGSISEAIFGRKAEPRSPQARMSTQASPGAAATPSGGQDQAAGGVPWWAQGAAEAQAQASGTSGEAAIAETDVAAELERRAAAHGEKLNWRTSIVDLMKLVGIDSSLDNRRELARELGYSGDTDDTATMNMWLHKQVMRELAANGGRVPAELTD